MEGKMGIEHLNSAKKTARQTKCGIKNTKQTKFADKKCKTDKNNNVNVCQQNIKSLLLKICFLGWP